MKTALRISIKTLIVVLYLMFLCEIGTWVVFGLPPFAWHDWYLAILPVGIVAFWPSRRGVPDDRGH
jgi:hypothetical protein